MKVEEVKEQVVYFLLTVCVISWKFLNYLHIRI